GREPGAPAAGGAAGAAVHDAAEYAAAAAYGSRQARQPGEGVGAAGRLSAGPAGGVLPGGLGAGAQREAVGGPGADREAVNSGGDRPPGRRGSPAGRVLFTIP